MLFFFIYKFVFVEDEEGCGMRGGNRLARIDFF